MAKNCFIFPGQGAQAIGMGKSLCEVYGEVKELYEIAENVTEKAIKKICFEGPEDDLNKTENSQLALLITSLASLKVLELKYPELKADLYAGLSLGEYSAQVAAGVLTFEDALKIVKTRSLLMQESCEENDGGMCSIIGLDKDKVQELIDGIDGYLTIANLNCPGQIVISGYRPSILEASMAAKEKGAKLAVVLKVAGAFHSKFMENAASKYKEFINGININSDMLPLVLSNVTGKPFSKDDDWPSIMASQITNSVLWEDNMRYAIDAGCEKFFELGTGKTLTGMMKRIDRKKTCINLGAIEDIEKLIIS